MVKPNPPKGILGGLPDERPLVLSLEKLMDLWDYPKFPKLAKPPVSFCQGGIWGLSLI